MSLTRDSGTITAGGETVTPGGEDVTQGQDQEKVVASTPPIAAPTPSPKSVSPFFSKPVEGKVVKDVAQVLKSASPKR